MPLGIEYAILDIQSKVATLTGINLAPDYPPEGIAAFPTAITWAKDGGTVLRSAGFASIQQTIVLDIHFGRGILPATIENSLPYHDLMMKLIIADPDLSNTVQGIDDIRTYYGFLTYGVQATKENPPGIGWRFEIDIHYDLTST